MIITDAYWEKRNLGVSTIEIQMEDNDNPEQIEYELDNITAEYVVVKVPSGRTDISIMVQNTGYRYIEDMIHVEHDLREVERSRMHQRLYDAMTYRMMTDEDLETLYSEILDGMFVSDRISNDPFFDNSLVGRRYNNWISDILKKGAMPYVILYKGDPAGFIVLTTKDEKVYESVLGGGYKKYRNTGLGIVQKEQEIVKKLGGKRLETHVSSNNAGQLRALEINGYITRDINHIYVKHNIEKS